MRNTFPSKDGNLRLRVIAGTHVILMAMDMGQEVRKGLRGFAIKRGLKGKPQEWLKGIKYFDYLIKDHKPGDEYSSREQPFQSFLWSDYQAAPAVEYDFTIIALYGDLGKFEEKYFVEFSVKTEPEISAGHGVWFNRGAIASHAFATTLHNQRLTPEMANKVSEDGQLLDDEAKWLSRGLAEACLRFINQTKKNESLHVCAYEFTYPPVLSALKRALDRGVDVQIIYHDTSKAENDPNGSAVSEAGLPDTIGKGHDRKQVLFLRTRPPIPHNKFIVKSRDGAPSEVWTGSTNFTADGFFGQTNVGHLVADSAVARVYFDYWTELSADPAHTAAMNGAYALTPNPPNLIETGAIVPFFSPRKADNMLDWYGQRIRDASSLAMMTIPFNVADQILAALDHQSDAMRLVVLEDVPTSDVTDAEHRNRGKLAFSNGALLGKSFIKYKSSFGGARVTPITNSPLGDWFVDEELARPTNSGHVFFIHCKVLLIDPLSDDPLVCSGSANFSKNSLVVNDENMLLIRGQTRVADIYMTEIDRIFRHFRARDIINHEAAGGLQKNFLLLDESDDWINENFRDGSFKNNRRLLFFPVQRQDAAWSAAAERDSDAFGDEDERAAEARRNKKEHAEGD